AGGKSEAAAYLNAEAPQLPPQNRGPGLKDAQGLIVSESLNFLNAPAARPAITTTPSPTSVTLGNAAGAVLTETATLSGGNSPTGTITFMLYSPSNMLLETDIVPVNGNGTYTTLTGYTLPSGAAAGTYHWDATFTSNSADNLGASDINDGKEQVI